MKLSTRTRYGLRAMIELGLNFNKGPVLMKSISENTYISRKYLHSILTSLKSAGLVRSIRGTGGCSSIARHPSEIKVSEVVSVLDGSLCVVECVENINVCEKSNNCIASDVWSELSEAIERTLENISLEYLILKKEKKDKIPIIYNI